MQYLAVPCPHCHHVLTLTRQTVTCTHCPFTFSCEQLPVSLTARQLDRLIGLGQLRVILSTPDVHAVTVKLEEETE